MSPPASLRLADQPPAGPSDRRNLSSERIADLAVSALVDEATLTPKPGLVDRRGSGAHKDLHLALMIRSARSLRPAFAEMAAAAVGRAPGQWLRERLAAIGRQGEVAMMEATGGVNSHRGAIWVIGLLVGGAVTDGPSDPTAIAARAAAIARHDDRFSPVAAGPAATNGSRVSARYGVGGARGEATAGFPHVVQVGLPRLVAGRSRGLPEETARLDALMAIMTSLDDTCLLHRGGWPALAVAKDGAQAVLAAGGMADIGGQDAFQALERQLLFLNASPGGCADLLAATLFLDRLDAAASGLSRLRHPRR